MPVAVKHLYNPLKKYTGYQRRNIMHCKPNSDLRVLACILRPDNVAAVINLLNVSSPTKESPIVAYVLHIMKLISGSHPVFISHDMQKKKVSHHSYSDELLWAFNDSSTVTRRSSQFMPTQRCLHPKQCTTTYAHLP
ncbi:hypothetical protein Nepgr_000052 [Nepenthes gracilis]|uniref:Uncharacterized protein n=1 Tax=Nepenthes gracilis TaxID=150966 RepID=A0AAD3P323_NEPGR|nr:hypothetical protein Nepgr_000052 [Nepenthes gracilis]